MTTWTDDELAHISAAGVERDVAFAEPDPGVRDAVDQAYRAKYARYGETYVIPMVSDDMVSDNAAAATLQLIPH